MKNKAKSKNRKEESSTGESVVNDLSSQKGYSTDVVVEEILRPMERGQITLPAKIRKNLGITPNTWLRVTQQKDKKITIEPVSIVDKDSDPNVIPAQGDFWEALDEFRKKGVTIWTEEDEKNRQIRRKLGIKRRKELQKLW